MTEQFHISHISFLNYCSFTNDQFVMINNLLSDKCELINMTAERA